MTRRIKRRLNGSGHRRSRGRSAFFARTVPLTTSDLSNRAIRRPPRVMHRGASSPGVPLPARPSGTRPGPPEAGSAHGIQIPSQVCSQSQVSEMFPFARNPHAVRRGHRFRSFSSAASSPWKSWLWRRFDDGAVRFSGSILFLVRIAASLFIVVCRDRSCLGL